MHKGSACRTSPCLHASARPWLHLCCLVLPPSRRPPPPCPPCCPAPPSPAALICRPGNAPAALAAAFHRPLLQPNFIYTHQLASNDPGFTNGNLWGMYGDSSTPANDFGSRAAEAWAAGFTGRPDIYIGERSCQARCTGKAAAKAAGRAVRPTIVAMARGGGAGGGGGSGAWACATVSSDPRAMQPCRQSPFRAIAPLPCR